MESPVYTVLISGDEHLTWDESVEQLMEQAARAVLESEEAPGCEVSLFLTDDEGIRALNKAYRSVDKATDVLSFGLDDEDQPGSPEEPLLLGDVIVSVERAREQAEEYGHSYEREVAFLVVHGVLHLLGYDHETDGEKEQMRAREEAVLTALGLSRN